MSLGGKLSLITIWRVLWRRANRERHTVLSGWCVTPWMDWRKEPWLAWKHCSRDRMSAVRRQEKRQVAGTDSKKRTEKQRQVLANRPVKGSEAAGTGVAHCQYPRAQSYM